MYVLIAVLWLFNCLHFLSSHFVQAVHIIKTLVWLVTYLLLLSILKSCKCFCYVELTLHVNMHVCRRIGSTRAAYGAYRSQRWWQWTTRTDQHIVCWSTTQIILKAFYGQRNARKPSKIPVWCLRYCITISANWQWLHTFNLYDGVTLTWSVVKVTTVMG